MKKVLMLFGCVALFISSTMQAQHCELKVEEKNSELSQKEFEEVKSRYASLFNSPNYKKMESLRGTLIKNQDKCSLPDFSEDSAFIPWMKENLHLSEFKSLEEAISLKNEYIELGEKVNSEDLRLNQLLKKASREQGMEIAQLIKEKIEKN